MKLITKEIQNKIPKLYETDRQPEDKKMVYIKLFCPWNKWTWYGIEYDGKDTFFGYVEGDANELGYFTLSELKSVQGPFGLKIERDKFFLPTLLVDIINKNDKI